MPLRLAAVSTVAILVLLAGCSDNGQPRVEALEDGTATARAVTTYEISGRRDGATTKAVAMLTLETGERLRLELDVTYDPTPTLASGRWFLVGTRPGAGRIHAESINFLGGQGEGPSVGGRFRLEEDGNPRFRVVLPLRPVNATRWTGE
jgi:hypothetical protein